METLDFDHNIFSQQNREADRNLAVRFYSMPIKNEDKSRDAGRPIYDDTMCIEIRVRGDRNNIIQRPVREEDKRRFPDVWRAHEQGKELLNNGTPLTEWPIMSASTVEELKHFGFYTVEQLATANDTILGRMPGLGNLKQRAKLFLELAEGAAPLEKLQKKVEDTESDNEALRRQVADLGARLAAMEKAKA